MKSHDHKLNVLLLFTMLASGCGSNSGAPTTTDGGLGEPAANKRLKYKDEYKKMLGKDGQLLWKPSSTNKRPPGIPK